MYVPPFGDGDRKANPPAGSHQGCHTSVIDVGYPNRLASFAWCDQLSCASLPCQYWLGHGDVRWPQRSTPPVTGMHQLVRRRPRSARSWSVSWTVRRSRSSPRRRAFLRYLVEETLAGHADGLKGYSLGLAVFGREGTFESQSDPVVRLEARRLRRDLDSYYVDAGARDPVRITIPKGQLRPAF